MGFGISRRARETRRPASRRWALLTTALLALLPACGAPAMATPSAATPPAIAATAPRANAAPATPAFAGEVGGQMTGTITRIEPRDDLGRILVEEHPDDPYGGDKDFATVTPGTRILERTAEGTAPRGFGDLQVGKRVTVTFLGAIAASYPGQGTAGEVTILRTRTDGPTSGPHAGTVTQIFRLSLFPRGDGVPPGDAFSVSYTHSGGGGDQRFFCGDDPRAPRPCAGRGTYAIRVEVPKGAEIVYSVERIPAAGAERAEVVERGREILDADMVATSHYRYGAPNPGGYSDAKPRATATRAGGGAPAVTTPTPGDTATRTPAIAFPQLAPVVGPRVMMAALLEGTLTLVDGCVRVTVPRGDSDLIVWPPEVTLRTDGGDIRVVDADGRVVARVGERVRMSGGQIKTIEGMPGHLLREAPPSRCPGPYWFTGTIEGPAPTATPRGTATRSSAVAPNPGDALDTDAREYANTFGVDLQEAKRRLRLQEPIGKLGAALAAGEGGTFAGLWIEHRPAYRVVVRFTRDGERTIRPYIAGGPLADLVEVRAARQTMAELEAALAETGRLVRPLDVPANVRLNLRENRVEVHVAERARFDAALREAGSQLPEGVVVLATDEPAR